MMRLTVVPYHKLDLYKMFILASWKTQVGVRCCHTGFNANLFRQKTNDLEVKYSWCSS